MSIPVLYCIDYSPWSEKAMWALDFHNIEYKRVEYIPLMTTPILKFKVRKKIKFTDKLTVPVLIDGADIYSESFDIARYSETCSEKNNNSEQLFPKKDLDRIRELDLLGERLLNLLRAQVFNRTKDIPEAKVERLHYMPENVRDRSVVAVDFIIKFLEKKYPIENSESITSLFEEIRSELNGRPYVLDDFSYADITLAQPIQFISPVSDQYVELGKFQRKTMEDDKLAEEFSDLVDWRNKLYEMHR